MAQDTRLFSTSSPIGRVWYYLNLILLSVLTVVFYIIMKYCIIPSAADAFVPILNIFLCIVYLFFAVTFFVLIDRRLLDIFGNRDSNKYQFVSKSVSSIILLAILTWLLTELKVNIFATLHVLQILGCIFAVTIFIIGLIPGKMISK